MLTLHIPIKKKQNSVRSYSLETIWKCGLLCRKAASRCVYVRLVCLPGTAQWMYLFSRHVLHIATGNQVPCRWPTTWLTWSAATIFIQSATISLAVDIKTLPVKQFGDMSHKLSHWALHLPSWVLLLLLFQQWRRLPIFARDKGRREGKLIAVAALGRVA